MFGILRGWVLISSVLLPLGMWAQGLDTTKIDGQLGRSGQKTGDVYKVGFPRNDLQVSVQTRCGRAGASSTRMGASGRGGGRTKRGLQGWGRLRSRQTVISC